MKKTVAGSENEAALIAEKKKSDKVVSDGAVVDQLVKDVEDLKKKVKDLEEKR